jgi:small subunit ribosomal protein S7
LEEKPEPEPPKEPETPEPEEKTETPEPKDEPEAPEPEGKVETPEPEEKPETPKPEEKPETPEPPKEPKAPELKEKKKPRAKKPSGLLLFNEYDLSEVVVRDAGLGRYINLDPVIIPHTGGRHADKRFGRAKTNIIERLINNMMRTENYTGKKNKSYVVVRKALGIIQQKTKMNPVQILVEALENAAPREEITRLRFGGINVPRAVDISPSRRLDVVIRNICKGAVAASHKNRKPAEQCLAEEIMLASKGDMNSFAVSKKDESERVAASAR